MDQRAANAGVFPPESIYHGTPSPAKSIFPEARNTYRRRVPHLEGVGAAVLSQGRTPGRHCHQFVETPTSLETPPRATRGRRHLDPSDPGRQTARGQTARGPPAAPVHVYRKTPPPGLVGCAARHVTAGRAELRRRGDGRFWD